MVRPGDNLFACFSLCGNLDDFQIFSITNVAAVNIVTYLLRVCEYFCETFRNVITGVKGMQSSHC